MSMEKDSTKALRRWRATIKANGTPAWWETSAGCSCVTSRRQNTPDLLRKYTFDCLRYYELCNCVVQVYWFNQCSLSILFICYKLLQLLKYRHIFSVYSKMILFKSQKTGGYRAKLFIILIQHTQIYKKTPISILASDQKFIFVKQCNELKVEIHYFSWWFFLFYIIVFKSLLTYFKVEMRIYWENSYPFLCIYNISTLFCTSLKIHRWFNVIWYCHSLETKPYNVDFLSHSVLLSGLPCFSISLSFSLSLSLSLYIYIYIYIYIYKSLYLIYNSVGVKKKRNV